MGPTSVWHAGASGTRRRSGRATIELALAGVGGAVLTVVAAAITAANVTGEGTALAAVARASTVGVPIAVGLYAWNRQPTQRFGRLLVALGAGWFLTTLAQSGDSVAFSVGRVAAWVMEVGLVYLVLAFPTGRLWERADRLLVLAGAALVAVLYLPTALLVTAYPEPSPWTNCQAACPENAFLAIGSQPAFVDAIVVPLRGALTIALFIAVAVRLVQRVWRASELLRRTLLPLLAVAIARLVVYAGTIAAREASPDSRVVDGLAWILALGVPALAVAFMIGLVERRLYVADALQTLGLWTRADVDPEQLRDAIATALDDASLEVAYPVDGVSGRWVDAQGRDLGAAFDGPGRARTAVRDGDRVVAVLIHDAALREHGAFVDAVAAFALTALENRRLSAEVDASLRELRDSRARIVASADRERQRIERDLHDGAQQRLVALGIQLRLADELLETEPAAGRARLRALHHEVDATLEEIRALAHGVYPPLLADRGLVAAVRSTARSAPIATTVAPDGVGRYSQDVESAVYFCCLEALQNVSKHATGATAVRIVLRHDDALRFEVRDDGPGFDPATASRRGVTNMRDRVAAIGGELEIRSTPGAGTVVAGNIPLGAAAPPGSERTS